MNTTTIGAAENGDTEEAVALAKFRNEQGRIVWDRVLAESYKINRKSQLDLADLYRLYDELKGNDFAIECVGSLLSTANSWLADSEREQRTPLDKHAAEITYAGKVFVFTRMP